MSRIKNESKIIRFNLKIYIFGQLILVYSISKRHFFLANKLRVNKNCKLYIFGPTILVCSISKRHFFLPKKYICHFDVVYCDTKSHFYYYNIYFVISMLFTVIQKVIFSIKYYNKLKKIKKIFSF